MARHGMQVGDHRPIDRAAMIEAASRSLRQQMGRTKDRPRSKGSLHDTRSSGDVAKSEPLGVGGGVGESAQRRNHSAENQHRLVSTSRDGPRAVSALDHYPPQEEALPDPAEEVGTPGLEVPPFYELKRPLSRKKGPSASAAAGLGAFSGPARVTDAFEQRKTRQPIPVESWGPRPPSRHGLPTKSGVAPLDTSLDEDPKIISPSSRAQGGPCPSVGRPSSRAGSDQPKVITGGTWAAARGVAPRMLGEGCGARRGREKRPPNRSAPPEDLGIFGRGTKSPTQQLSKSLSGVGVGVGVGVFDHPSPFKEADGPAGARQLAGAWASLSSVGGVDTGVDAQEEVPGPWPITPTSTCNTPPIRRGRHSIPEAGTPVSLEDVEGDPDFWGDRTPPQAPVIVTRSSQGSRGRGDPRRRDREQARPGDKDYAGMPFKTTLDVDFLSLFAS